MTMGLLDITDDPQRMGLLSMGLRLMSTPGKFGQAFGSAGMGALNDVQQAQQAQAKRKQAAMQEQMTQLQLQQVLDQQARKKKIEDAYRGAIRTPEMNAMAANGGPTMAAAEAAPNAMPSIDQQALIRGLMGADPMAAAEMLQPKPADYKVVGDALLQVGPGGVKEAYRAPEKPEKMPESIRAIEAIYGKGTPEAMAALRQLGAKMTTHAPGTNVNVNTGERIPTQLVKQQDDLIDKMSVARATDADLGAIEAQIKAGALKFGPVRNLVNAGKNVAGVSDDESRAFGTFKSTLEKLRNDSLRLNAGVQTEGDAQRAWNELFQNINDTKFVEQRLGEIRRINKRAAGLHEYRLQVLRSNSGAGALPPADVPPALDTPSNKVRVYNPQTGKIE